MIRKVWESVVSWVFSLEWYEFFALECGVVFMLFASPFVAAAAMDFFCY